MKIGYIIFDSSASFVLSFLLPLRGSVKGRYAKTFNEDRKIKRKTEGNRPFELKKKIL
jgi:hypothetical protein